MCYSIVHQLRQKPTTELSRKTFTLHSQRAGWDHLEGSHILFEAAQGVTSGNAKAMFLGLKESVYHLFESFPTESGDVRKLDFKASMSCSQHEFSVLPEIALIL